MKTKKPLIYAGYIGVVLMALGLFLMSSFPKYVPYMAKGFQTPIIFFEFVQTVDEAQQMFGMTGGLLPDDNLVQKMDFANKVDFIYAFVYALFLFVFARALVKISGKKIFIAVMVRKHKTDFHYREFGIGKLSGRFGFTFYIHLDKMGKPCLELRGFVRMVFPRENYFYNLCFSGLASVSIGNYGF